MRRILILQGHPDPLPSRLCVALADAYAEGAELAGHQVTRLTVAELDLPARMTPEEFQNGAVPPTVALIQQALREAEHWVVVYPLWLGDMPALLKGFFEQVLRPGFAFREGAGLSTGLLKGRSARIVVTMGMPGFVFRTWFLSASLRALRWNILSFVGIGPVRETVIGAVGGLSARRAGAALAAMRRLGASAR